MGLWHTNRPHNLGQKTKSYNNNQQQQQQQQQQKRTSNIVEFAVPADHRIKLKENEKKDKYLNLARELKTMEHESDNYTNHDWCFWYSHQRII